MVSGYAVCAPLSSGEKQPAAPAEMCQLPKAICMLQNWLCLCVEERFRNQLPLALLPPPKRVSVILVRNCTYFLCLLYSEMRCILGTLGEVDAWVCVSSLPVPQASDLFTSVLMF